MARETKAAKAKRIGMLLAAYDALNREANKLAVRVKELKLEIRGEALDEGTYGEMTLAYGTPKRMLDQQEAKRMLIERKLGVPMIETEPSLIIKPITK